MCPDHRLLYGVNGALESAEGFGYGVRTKSHAWATVLSFHCSWYPKIPYADSCTPLGTSCATIHAMPRVRPRQSGLMFRLAPPEVSNGPFDPLRPHAPVGVQV